MGNAFLEFLPNGRTPRAFAPLNQIQYGPLKILVVSASSIQGRIILENSTRKAGIRDIEYVEISPRIFAGMTTADVNSEGYHAIFLVRPWPDHQPPMIFEEDGPFRDCYELSTQIFEKHEIPIHIIVIRTGKLHSDMSDDHYLTYQNKLKVWKERKQLHTLSLSTSAIASSPLTISKSSTKLPPIFAAILPSFPSRLITESDHPPLVDPRCCDPYTSSL